MISYLAAYGSGLVGLFLLRAGDTVYHHAPFRKNADLTEACELSKLKKVPVKSVSSLIGLFHSGNSNGIVQAVDPESEWSTYMKTKFTCLGNLILCNDKGALISPALKKEKKKLEKILGVKCTTGTIAGLQTVGTLGIANNHGAVFHQEATEAESAVLKSALKVDQIGPATISKSGFVGASAIASDDSLILSPGTMTPEMAQIAEILDID
ncbi:MAG: hypothetical protein GOV00_03090 [Candidatus Altiarchaeota archaeon]|nr:hypothetical protein [Candidatus Altiarchaeota archaeon]